MKTFILLLSYLSLFISAPVFAGSHSVAILRGSGGGVVCSGTPYANLSKDTHTGSITIDGSTTKYGGFKYLNASSVDLCSISFYMRRNGDLSGETLYIEVWSVVSGSQALDTKLDTIMTYDASTLPTTIGYVNFTFPTPYTIGTNNVLVITTNSVPSNTITLATAGAGTIADQDIYSASPAGTAILSGGDVRMLVYLAE